MRAEWATSGLDLFLRAAPEAGRRDGLERALREAIRAGRLPAGTRLPASRGLARDIGVSRGTVTHAYAQLVAEGYLIGRHGSGTYVADRPLVPARTPAAPTGRGTDRVRHDLRPGTPDLTTFPRAAWLAATRRVLNEAPAEAFGAADPAGRPELREALAAYLGRARGVVTAPERIVVCNGYAQAVTILCHVLAAQGRRGAFAFEDPSLPKLPAAARRAGLATPTIPVDDEGARIGDLRADAAVVTPAHQYPMGVTLSARRRGELVDWTRATGGLLVEDDYDGEFRYDRQPVGALQGLAPERIVYAGTASKTISPGLRLAWLALPGHLVAPVAKAKSHLDRYSETLSQLVLADLISSGGYDRHIRRCRTRYRHRRDRLVNALAAGAPGLALTGIEAGLHALLPLPTPEAERQAQSQARRAGLAVDALADYYATPTPPRSGLVIGYGTPPEHGFTPAVDALLKSLHPLNT
ncbi:MAG TPA: PLP-dependent aminotransferase family protein [Streptosporangiaceae bacterium]|jgi:GntR family transcriptional regulator/MocR family aminotransferase